ncbi:Arc-like DNA binding domain-containing protein [Kaistia soli DSM 19436]|uniref:Arc-like DNA binding domain-containing protein n=1 Tax=Kaistia soli DSM 19436 TaxID=1122133 RepID=A0A1M5CZK6_9HYPH|nr:Arc family DNA-binding protein [Kaistia soli]SHF60065.1 Arc-like DNA binding domain-containing protein [Kaistia soli DSM 19436]
MVLPEKPKVKDYEQFQLRLPPGMRDRIKAKAERAGMSMNEAVVWCLEHFFPAPKTLDEKLEELATMAALLKAGGEPSRGVDRLIDEISGVVDKIYEGKIATPPDFRANVSEQLERWQEERMEIAQEDAYNPFEEPELPMSPMPPLDDSEEPF